MYSWLHPDNHRFLFRDNLVQQKAVANWFSLRAAFPQAHNRFPIPILENDGSFQFEERVTIVITEDGGNFYLPTTVTNPLLRDPPVRSLLCEQQFRPSSDLPKQALIPKC